MKHLKLARMVFAVGLRSYPRDYRRCEQAELELLFDDLAQRELRERGPLCLWLLVVRCLGDSLVVSRQLRRVRALERSAAARKSLGRNDRSRRSGMMDVLQQELTSAWRSIVRQPWMAVTAAATLAVGIGASISMFSVVYGVLLRPLGLEEPQRLVNIRQHAASDPSDASGLSVSSFAPLADRVEAIEAASAWFYDSVTLTDGDAYRGDAKELGEAIVVAPNFFEVLGLDAFTGRVFLPDDVSPGAGRGTVAVLGHQLFESTFGSDPELVGSSLTIDGVPTTVVGVVSAVPPAPIPGTQIWLAHGFDPEDRALTRRLLPIARLADGASLEQLEEQLDVYYQGLASEVPALEGWTGGATRFRSDLLGPVEGGLWVAFAGIGMLLLMACANFANLMMARLSTKKNELSTRACLGASQYRLFRQLSIESLMLSILGGGAGVALAMVSLPYLVAMSGPMLPRAHEVRLDWPVLVFATFVAVACGLVFGNAPAAFGIAGEMRSSNASRRTRNDVGTRVRATLAAVQIGLALTLLAGAALLVSSFHRLTDSDPGIDIERVAAARIYPDDDRYATLEEENLYFEELLQNLEAVPGVERVAMTSALPMDPQAVDFDLPFRRADRPAEAGAEPPQAFYRMASPGYFETLGIELRSGRTFVATDLDGAPTVIVNETMAKQVWPDEPSVGGQLLVGFRGTVQYEVVGVVSDTSFSALGAPPKPEMYFPSLRASFGGRVVVVRTEGDPADTLNSIRASALSVDPNQPVSAVMTLKRLTADTVAAQGFYSKLSGIIGMLAIALALSGIYALISFWVSQSQFELGVRMAVGATRENIVRLVVGKAFRLAVAGSTIGLGASLLLLGNLRVFLFDTEPLDPATLALATAAILILAVLAAWIPARIAARSSLARMLSD